MIKTQTMTKIQATTSTAPQVRTGAGRVTVAAASPQPKRSRRVAAPSMASSPDPAPTIAVRRLSKQATIEALVRRSEGAVLAELMSATGWQQHSVRAALSGLSKRGFPLLREPRAQDGSIYRMSPAPASARGKR